MSLSAKYWFHHKKRALSLICAITVSTMAMTVGVFLARSASQGDVEKILNACGDYDLLTLPIEKAQLEILQQNDQIAEYGVILNGGTCRTQYSESVLFGAFASAQAQEMFHYTPEKGGRYPIASGEVCGYKEAFHTLGVAPVVGNRISLEMYDSAGNAIGEREFTIVGVLNEADSYYGEARTLRDASSNTGVGFAPEKDLDLPEMFFCSEDMPDIAVITAMIRCVPDAAPAGIGEESVEIVLKEQGIPLWRPYPYRIMELCSIAGVDARTERDLFDRARLSYNDFYSSILIPVFLGIVLLVSFISVYVVMADAMKERMRQFGLYRSMGMSVREVRGRLLSEALFFDIVGVAAGYLLGILLYLIYLGIFHVAGDVYVYNAFHVHPIARAISIDPFIWPWALGFLFSCAALVSPIFFATRLSPNAMLLHEKSATRVRNKKRKVADKILNKITGEKLSGNRLAALLIFVTGWSFVFGAAFMMAKADIDNFSLYNQLAEAGNGTADYMAQKDIRSTMCGNAVFNRHGEGISAADMAALSASGDVASIQGVIELPGLKVLCDGERLSPAQEETLAPLDIDHNVDEFLRDLFGKTKTAIGYAPDDRICRLPSAAIDDALMESLAPYVISGELDMEGLADGSRIVIAEYPGASLPDPFAAGDTVTLTDAVISDDYVENWDMSRNMMPDGVAPSFTYDYADGSAVDLPGYAYGEKIVFQSQICAILRIDDEQLADLLCTDSYVDNETHTGELSPGYGILCCTGAPSAWGLPDRCYTDVRVNLKPSADIDRFELLWYTIIGRSGNVKSTVQNDIWRRIERTDRSNLLLFAAMITLVIFTGCFGMVNAYRFAVNRNMRNLQILRAVGIDRRALAVCHIRELFLWPLCAILTSLLPIPVFDLVRRYAQYYLFELGHNHSILIGEGIYYDNWAMRFPWYIELWKQPIPLIMAAAFVCLVLLNIAAAVSPLRRMQKTSIVDGIRTDDF